MENNQWLEAIKKALDQKFAQDITVLDLRELSPSFDYFVLATAGSQPQMQALTQAAEECMKQHGYKLGHVEGLRSGDWVLLDFGVVVVHVFDRDSRQFYNLERVWGDAKIV